MSTHPNPHSGNRRFRSLHTFAIATITGLIVLAHVPTAFAASITFTSVGAEDGFITESGENTSVGGTANAGGTSGQGLRGGDDTADKQIKTIVSFNTASLPDNAIIVSAQLRLRRGTVFGNNPFGVLGVCRVDIKGGSGFGGAAALAAGDFQATADATQVATLDDAPANDDWSEGMLNSTGLSFINKTGKTQFRVYFATGDNDDMLNDYMGWYSGAHATGANHPQLVVTYNTGDTTPPTVSMTAPADGATVSGNVTVSANASDNVGVVGVQFKLNGNNLGAEDLNSPYSITWNTLGETNAQHVLTATARDAAGNTATSTGRLVTVNNPRNVHWEFDLETGQLQSRTTALHDAIGAKTLQVTGPTKSITSPGVTKATQGVVTSANHGYTDGTGGTPMTGVTITGVNGMTQLNGRLFRVRNMTTNNFQLWEDQRPGQPNPNGANGDLGTLSVNTSTYGNYTSGGTLMTWVEQIINGGGAGPGTNFDVRVVASESVNGQTVLPRRGNYFLRSAIHFEKDYSVFGGNSDKNKARWNGNPPDSVGFDYDTEVWHGMSHFIPNGFEAETSAGTKGHGGQNQLLDLTEDAGDSGHGFFIIDIRTPGSGTGTVPLDGDEPHWIGRYSISPTSTTVNQTTIYYDFGRVGPDKGKWTDWVIRSRVNPFSVTTNPASQGIPGAINQTYQGNKGILQVWKATGTPDANGNRTMQLMIDLVNTPVGGVPRMDTTVSPAVPYKIKTSVRQYKFGWHHNPTSVTGPIWIGYDEIRMGWAANGTGYSDVHPAQLPMP